MSRHDEPLYDDEPPELRVQRLIKQVMEKLGLDKLSARRLVQSWVEELNEDVDPDRADEDLLLRRIKIYLLLMNKNEQARALRYLIWLKNTR